VYLSCLVVGDGFIADALNAARGVVSHDYDRRRRAV
jgi:hypothetical protein